MIIVENCTNWRDLDEAKEMIRVAHEVAPGSLSKFQLFNAEEDKGKFHYPWVKAHELTFEQAKELFDYGASIGQEVFFSVFGVKYVDWCERIGVKRYKIAAAISDLRDYDYNGGFLYSAATKARAETNRGIVAAIKRTGKGVIASESSSLSLNCSHLYCPSGYPPTEFIWPSFEGVCEESYQEAVDGFSDHTIGLDVAKIALARGAQIIEKHFVLKHNKDFPDDAWSMTPEDLRELVRWEKVCREVLG